MIETVTGMVQGLHTINLMHDMAEYPLKTQESSTSQENPPKPAVKNYNAFGVPLLQILEKLYFSVQCNYALDQHTVQLI